MADEFTLGDLRAIASEHPDAPKWWLGDWANKGAERFDITPEQAVDLANAAAHELRPDWYRGSLLLPAGTRADATSLRLPPEMPKEDWARLGGFLARMHDEADPSLLPRKLKFKFQDLYPADDLLSEWLATISMAANDLIAVHVLMAETEDDSLRWYFFRAAVGHFYEVAKHMEDTEALPEIQTFVASLPQPARVSYEKVLSLFKDNKAQLSNMRNVVFHYPSLMNPQQRGELRANRDLPTILQQVAEQQTVVRMGRLKDVRFEYADELTARLVIRKVGTVQNYEKLQDTVREAVQEFMRFMNPALDEHVTRRQQAGANLTFE